MCFGPKNTIGVIIFFIGSTKNSGGRGNAFPAICVNAFSTTNFRSQSAMHSAAFHGNRRCDSTTHILSIGETYTSWSQKVFYFTPVSFLLYLQHFIIPYCDTAPVHSSLIQAISASWRTGGRTTHLCGTGIERVVRRRERTPAPSYGNDRRRPK